MNRFDQYGQRIFRSKQQAIAELDRIEQAKRKLAWEFPTHSGIGQLSGETCGQVAASSSPSTELPTVIDGGILSESEDNVPAAQPDRDTDNEYGDEAIAASLKSLHVHHAGSASGSQNDDKALAAVPYAAAELDEQAKLDELHQDRQPDTPPGSMLDMRSGMKFDLKLSQWIDDTVSAVQADASAELLAAQVGKRVTKDTESDVAKLLSSVALKQTAKQEAGSNDAGMSAFEKKEHARLLEGIKGVEAKSYLGNVFRAFLKQTPEEMKKYEHCATRVSRSAFRIQWAKQQMKEFETNRVHRQSWSRVDTTTGEYKNFSKLVVDLADGNPLRQ
jgi:hypothetical protein